jgi:hypothetical protein
VDVEVVADDIPPCIGCSAAQQTVEKSRKIPLGAGVAHDACDLAGDIETGNQCLRAVAAIFELAPLDPARLHRQSRRGALQGLNAGHLVDRDPTVGLIGTSCGLVNLADVGAFGVKGSIGLRRQPITKALRFEVNIISDNSAIHPIGVKPRNDDEAMRLR